MGLKDDLSRFANQLSNCHQALIDSGWDVGEEPAFDKAMQELERLCDEAEDLHRDIVSLDNRFGQLYREL